MEFRLLGPLEVRRDGVALGLGGPRQSAVLAALAIRANETVSVDHLAAAAWQRPPVSLRSNVRSYVTKLRRLLAGDRIVSVPDGYRLVVHSGELDLAVFEDLVTRATQADAATAANLFGEALGVWRGSPLAGLRVGPALETEVARLEERRLQVVEQHIGTRLRLGEHDEVMGELRAQVAEHPFREGFVEQLMLALYQSGRQAEALEVYQKTRERVVAELGIEPGPRLRELQLQILGGEVLGSAGPVEPPASAAPAELPAVAAAFTGRDDELERLDQLLDRVANTVVVATLIGTAGVGKTALAVHWAHSVAHWFPDGQVFVDLAGYREDPTITATEALGRLLRSIGVPPELIPSGQEAMAAMYRSRLAGRRMLIVLDNARTAEQVRPLLPGQAGCLVVVTSRDRLGGLAALDGAVPITVDPLTPEQSWALLGRILDRDRSRAEPLAVAELARLCGHLPLALRLAAARLSGQPGHSVQALVARLQQGDRLSALQVPGDPVAAVRLAFDHSYQGLDETSRRLFRRLALVPGADLTRHVAAELLDTSLGAVDPVLDVLTSASLVEEHESGRYRLHDLLRHYAADLTIAEDSTSERDAAIRRVLGWYLYTARAATAVLDPHRRRTVELDPGIPNQRGLSFAGYDRALAWCEAERVNLVASVRHASDHGFAELAWQIPIALFGFLELRRYWSDWISTHEIALTASRQAGDRHAEAWTLNSLGIVHKQTGRLDLAVGYYQRALEIRRATGDRHGEAVTLNNLGSAAKEGGSLAAAVSHYEEALDIFRDTGDRWGEGLALANLGEAQRSLGSSDVAERCLSQALTIRRELGDRRGEGIVLHNLAEAFRESGRGTSSIGHYRRALVIRQAVGDRWGVARTLTGLGLALAGVDDAAATDCWQRALAIFDDLGDPQAAEVRAHLKT